MPGEQKHCPDYGNLTSGSPEAVNYYGYNGESANVKTGFQYLRARYYYAENGTFTTEDSDLGTKENPFTRNRYSYVMNNPLNYADPTGHRVKAASGIGRAGVIVKSIGNIVKTVTNVVKAAGVAMAVGSIHGSTDRRDKRLDTGSISERICAIREVYRWFKLYTIYV